jgi:hypothetical protein
MGSLKRSLVVVEYSTTANLYIENKEKSLEKSGCRNVGTVVKKAPGRGAGFVSSLLPRLRHEVWVPVLLLSDF